MSSLNKVQIIGNLGRAPEVRTLQSGDRVALFSVATSESWKDKNGEKQERTQWHNIVIFAQGLVGVVERFLDKGSKVYIEGQLETRSWEKDGEKRYATEIVLRSFGSTLIMLDGKGGDISKHNEDKANGYQPQQNELEDEIPF